MSAPRFVNTTDGMCWTRREATRDGHELYALAAVEDCPAHLMETYAELEGHGIAGSADVLPVPVGSQPQASERDRLRAAFVEALDNASRTHPCPTLGDQTWSGCVHYDEAGRVVGVGSCHSERRADAVLAVRDAEVKWALGEVDRLTARVAELETERHSTNEALDDAVQELRARPSCPCPPEVPPAPHQVGCFFDGVPVSPPSERPVNGPSPLFPTVAALREVLDGEHFATVHHDYRPGLGRELPLPDGCRLSEEQVRELGQPFLDGAHCLEAHQFSPRDGWRMICGGCDHGKDAPCHWVGV